MLLTPLHWLLCRAHWLQLHCFSSFVVAIDYNYCTAETLLPESLTATALLSLFCKSHCLWIHCIDSFGVTHPALPELQAHRQHSNPYYWRTKPIRMKLIYWSRSRSWAELLYNAANNISSFFYVLLYFLAVNTLHYTNISIVFENTCIRCFRTFPYYSYICYSLSDIVAWNEDSLNSLVIQLTI